MCICIHFVFKKTCCLAIWKTYDAEFENCTNCRLIERSNR